MSDWQSTGRPSIPIPLDRSQSFNIKRMNVPFGFGVFPHRVSNGVDFLPAFSPLVGVAFFCAHVYNLQFISPSLSIRLFVFDAVSFDRPFSWTFPFHDTTALIGSQDNDKLLSSTEKRFPSIHSM